MKKSCVLWLKSSNGETISSASFSSLSLRRWLRAFLSHFHVRSFLPILSFHLKRISFVRVFELIFAEDSAGPEGSVQRFGLHRSPERSLKSINTLTILIWLSPTKKKAAKKDPKGFLPEAERLEKEYDVLSAPKSLSCNSNQA
jgi:hypothetical protein